MWDLTGIDAQADFKGEFPATITKVTPRLSKAGNNYLSMEFTVFGDKFKGRKIIESFVEGNDIAKQRMASMVDCIGMDRLISDPQVFTNKQLVVKVALNKDDEYSSIKGFKKYEAPTDFPT